MSRLGGKIVALGPGGATLRVDGVGDCVKGVTPCSLILFLARGSSGSELSRDARLDVLRGSAGGPELNGMTGLTFDVAGEGTGTEPGRCITSSLLGGEGIWAALNGGCMGALVDGIGPGDPTIFLNMAGPGRWCVIEDTPGVPARSSLSRGLSNIDNWGEAFGAEV
jgi:hypothetical protein